MITVVMSRRMECAVNVARLEARRYACKMLVTKPEKKRSLERYWHSGSVIYISGS
jgi:hypothetical protein